MIVIQNSMEFVNYSVVDHELLNKIIYDVGKLQRAHPTLRGHFASAYLVRSNMLRAYLFFIYGFNIGGYSENHRGHVKQNLLLFQLCIKIYSWDHRGQKKQILFAKVQVSNGWIHSESQRSWGAIYNYCNFNLTWVNTTDLQEE